MQNSPAIPHFALRPERWWLRLRLPWRRMPLPPESSGKPEKRPRAIDRASRCRQLLRNTKMTGVPESETFHYIQSIRCPLKGQLQYDLPGRSNCFQKHISESKKLRPAERRCRFGSAKTAQSFFQDQHLV